MATDDQPYLSDEVLAEVAGRLKFGGEPLQTKIDQIPEPEPKPWSWPTHPRDYIAEHFGMRGFELQALEQEAQAQLKSNPMLREAYAKFLMVAKLTCSDAVENVRKYERRQAEEKAKRDASYRSKKSSYDGRIVALTNSWTQVRDTIFTRWQRMGRSILKMLEKNASTKHMAPRDLAFVEELARRGIAAIDSSSGKVVQFSWDKYVADISIEDINAIIQMLDALPSGGFIKKPTKFQLEEATEL